MNPDAVAQYLQHNPSFFEEYADLMAQIFVPHPHGGRAISLPERQMLTLREKVRALEHTLAELVATGRSNDALSDKMHRLTLGLLAASPVSPARVMQTLDDHLREDFAIPHTTLRLWGATGAVDGPACAGPVSEALRQWAAAPDAGAKLPYCGPVHGLGAPVGEELTGWFGEAGPHLKSLALMALRGGTGSGGLLVLASEDERRFYAGMGTLYLERLAESLSAALAQLFPAA